MATAVRDRMVEAAAELLARHGIQATSFAAVIAASGASRGSIYHHFPDGKGQLVAEAIDWLGSQAFDSIEEYAGESAEVITCEYLRMWRSFIDPVGGFTLRGGCAILTVTVTADSDQLIDRAASVFRGWRTRLAELLSAGGLDAADAVGFSATLISAAEGALVLARAERNFEPFDRVANQLTEYVHHLAATGAV